MILQKRFLACLGFGLLWLAPTRAVEPLIVTEILEVPILNQLEDQGFGLSEMLGGPKASSTLELANEIGFYRSFADQIAKPMLHDKRTDQMPAHLPENSGDIPELIRQLRGFEDIGSRSGQESQKGYFIRQLSNNSQFPYQVERNGDEPRHFDPRWLRSEFGFMKLIAIVNRMDRADITQDSCGEVRFIYRLSYRSQTSASSLPFFVSVVQEYPKRPSCIEIAKSWKLASVDASALRNGPLKNMRFRQLELNFQALRFTSGYMQDFGGQALYIQRVFRKKNDKLEPVELENTPDVRALQRDPKLLKKFVELLKRPENLNALDTGTWNIPMEPPFFAKISLSWSTLGRARMANRPYTEIFNKKRDLLKGIDYSQLKFIKSEEALIERLNNLTCMGCHQTGGTAGFHLLGQADEKFSHPFNRQQVALSPHALAEMSRRQNWLQVLAAGGRPSIFRPHSSFSSAEWSSGQEIPKFGPLRWGQLCFAENEHFAGSPICEDAHHRPLECRRTVKNSSHSVLLGECVLKSAAQAGHVCWEGDIEDTSSNSKRADLPFNLFSFQDKWNVKGSVPSAAKSGKCVLPSSGAPLGRTSRKCTKAEENFEVDFEKGTPVELCANQGGTGFDMCAASGDSGACLEKKVARSMLDTCSSDRTCREDYICQQFPEYQKISSKDYVRRKEGLLIHLSTPDQIKGEKIKEAQRKGVGFCVPTYFLFNMRVDGHPSPVTGRPPGKPKTDRTLPLRGYK